MSETCHKRYETCHKRILKHIIGEGNGNPLQYSCMENPMDRGIWQATVYGVTRVGHDLVTKPPKHVIKDMKHIKNLKRYS